MRSSAGRPLDAHSRAFFEPRFGRDFSHVRVHTDATAASSARTINAHAFTAGSNIFFAAGRYNPGTDSGLRLIAHELTHTIQKSVGPQGGENPPAASAHRFGSETAEFAVAQAPQQPIELEQRSPAEKLNREEGGADASAPPPQSSTADPSAAMDAGVPGSPAQAPPVHAEFEEIQLTTDAEEMKRRLEGYVEDHGLESLQAIGPQFETDLNRRRFENSPEYLSDVSGIPDWIETNRRTLALIEEAAPAFRAAHQQVVQESNEFLAVFDVQAHVTLSQMLSASEERILSERERYGLTRTVTEHTRRQRGMYGEPATVIEQEAHYSMGDNEGTRGMAAAAGRLAEKVRAIRSLMDQRNATQSYTASEYVSEEQLAREMAAYREGDERVQHAVREYNTMRNAAENDYPILAAYTPLDTTGTYYVDQTIDRLSTVAAGSTSRAAESLYDETAERLANIGQVYEAVVAGDLSVWKLPAVVSLTAQNMNALPPLMQARLVSDKVDQVQSAGEILHTALAVLAIALGALAAIPTGGSSLAAGVAVAAGIGSAALGIGMAAEHIQQYAIEAAANGTDFDKARAISQVEPSLFWLAVDIVGALGGAAADIHAAAAAFRSLSTTLREAAQLRQLAQQGERVAEADAKMAQLASDGDRVAPGLGRRLTEAVTREGTAIERDAAVAAWEGSLSAESRAFLVDNPEIRAIYREMDADLRWLCTHCSVRCLIENISRDQVTRLRTVMRRLESEDMERLRIYLHVRKDSIESAISNLERVADSAGMTALFERSLTELANPATAPILSNGAATAARTSAGQAAGGEFLPTAGADWLRNTGGSSGMIPGQVAARLRGRQFASFDEFQEAFWREVSNDPVLMSGFDPVRNQPRLLAGNAPFVAQTERWSGAGRGRFVLHHIIPIEHGGGVYDMSNLLVTSPRLHWGIIHSPTAPMAPFRQLPLGE